MGLLDPPGVGDRLRRLQREAVDDRRDLRLSGPRRWRRLAGRRGSAAAALAFATLLCVLTLGGLPGMSDSHPPTANAAARLVVAIDAGLAKVDTVQGVMVSDWPLGSQVNTPKIVLFAATAAGDRLVDVRYKPNWTQAQSQYRTSLAALRKTKAQYSPGAYARALSDLKGQSLVMTRTVFVDAASDHSTSWAFFSNDPSTRRLAAARYYSLGWDNSLQVPPMDVDASRVWELATQLRCLLADHPDIVVSDTTYDGRPAFRVPVPATASNPAFVATVDRQYGVTLAVRVLPGALSGDSSMTSFHVEQLQVNRALPPSTFIVKPDYRTASRRTRPAGLQVRVEDLAKGAPTFHWFSAAELARVAAGTELVPKTIPAGYRLAAITRYGDNRQTLLLIYRRGMNEFVVWSGAREANPVDSGSGPSPSDHIAAFDRTTWPDQSGANQFVRIRGGALGGAPAALFAGIDAPASLSIWTDTRAATIDGDLSRAELLAVAGSLRPLKSGTWGASSASLAGLLAIVAALIAAVATTAAWLVIAHRSDLARRPRLGVLFWPLVGLVLVIVGASLSWHALLHYGTGFALRGWDEPLGRWVIALALTAVCCAAWRQLTTRWRGPIGPRLLAILLAAAALAGAVFALVYLPLEARFTVSTADGSVTDESWLTRIVASHFSPSASIGLYLSILGALFLLVGVVMMRRANPDP